MGRISRGHPSPWRPRTPQAVEVGVRACVGEDGRVSFRDLATTLAFEGSGHHGGTARGVATTDEVVDEGDEAAPPADHRLSERRAGRLRTGRGRQNPDSRDVAFYGVLK